MNQTNRSTGTVADYLRCISEGRGLMSIGAQYGVSHAAVYKALQGQRSEVISAVNEVSGK